MIRHVVFCRFKPDASPEAIAGFIREVDRVPELNPEVRNWVSGRSIEPRCHSGGYDWALTCDLPSWEAMDRYMWHEAHIRTMPFAQDVVDYLESFDFEITFEAPSGLRGAGERAVASTDGLQVPDVRGRTESDARAVLEAAGLEVEPEVRTVLGAAWAPGRVLATRPRPGAEIAPGSSVALTVAGDWWSKPDFSAVR